MNLAKLEIRREIGVLPNELEFVKAVNAVTAASFGAPVPLGETFDHLAESNLGHFVYVIEAASGTKLIAYALNDIYEQEINGVIRKVNYFSSAFIIPEAKQELSLYRLLGTLRVMNGEEFLMVRTQNPEVMSFFRWLCRFVKAELFSPLSRDLPSEIREIVSRRFGQPEMVFPHAYGRCLTGAPIEPATPFARGLCGLIDPDRGDAIVMVGRK